MDALPKSHAMMAQSSKGKGNNKKKKPKTNSPFGSEHPAKPKEMND
jgi:hypothetical protein